MKGKIVTDFSIFLPNGSNAQDRLLLLLLREGNGSRTMLVSMNEDNAESLARLNKRMARDLMASGRFVQILNGEAGFIQDDISFLFRNRYLLSPGVKGGSFTARGLRESLERQVKGLSSSRGILQKRYFANDPSGEFLQVMKNMSVGNELQRHDGVWFSKDRRSTIFVAEVRSRPFVIDSLQHDLGLIRKKFEEYTPKTTPNTPKNVRQDCPTIRRCGRHDAFRERLPRSAESTWDTLLNEGEVRSLAALARLTGRCRDTERKNVLALEAVGLVKRDGRRLKALVRDLDTLTVELGTEGACERKRERHQEEREAFEAVRSVRDLLRDVARRRRQGPLPLKYERAQGPLPEIQPTGGEPENELAVDLHLG